jgi:CorA-like Mg2+ transporter protein
LIAHFHKAALLSMSNRFSRAVERLRVRDFESVKLFKRHVRETLEVFLRFNHRYWFHEISNQVQASDFFKRWSHQLGSDALYAEVREEARDINEYLDADRARKQTDNTTRLTVVSACGMVGTIVTGFLGMNLYSHSDLQTQTKLLIFFAVFIPTVLLSLYTVMISRRVAAFMEALASEGLTWREKFTTFRQIWGADKRAAVRARRSADGFSSEAD